MNKVKFSLYLSILLLMLLIGGNGYAYSDIFYSVGTAGVAPQMELRTASLGALKTLTFNTGLISSSSYSNPVSDPIIGYYNTITTALMDTNGFSYRLKTELSPGVWSLTDFAGNPMDAAIMASSTADPTAGVIYFQGNVRATTIDLVNGTINWQAVSNPTFPTTLAGSETLAQLQYYVDNTILTSFKFAGSEALATWVRTNATNAGQSFDFSTNVTVVPEPGEWALILAGLGLIALRSTGSGLSLRHR